MSESFNTERYSNFGAPDRYTRNARHRASQYCLLKFTAISVDAYMRHIVGFCFRRIDLIPIRFHSLQVRQSASALTYVMRCWITFPSISASRAQARIRVNPLRRQYLVLCQVNNNPIELTHRVPAYYTCFQDFHTAIYTAYCTV